MRGERWGGLHPILGSCSFGRFDLHNLFPLRAEPPLTIFQYRSSIPELAGEKIPLCVILPPKNRRGGAMEQATRNGRFRASFPSFYLLSTPRSSSRGRPASTAAGRETRATRPTQGSKSRTLSTHQVSLWPAARSGLSRRRPREALRCPLIGGRCYA